MKGNFAAIVLIVLGAAMFLMPRDKTDNSSKR
jgi:hypothetical protein